MLNIENAPRTVENIRSTSLAIRQLSTMCSAEQDNMFIAFCFGLLTVNFAPLWNEACAALKVVAGRSGVEVWEMAFPPLVSEKNEESEDVEKNELAKLDNEMFAEKIWNEGQQDFIISSSELV